jgi:predicted alpha/beta superfamily hydrolase
MTVVEVIYPRGRGHIGMRGSHSPLSWDQTSQPSQIDGDRHVFRLPLPIGEVIELKLVRNDEAWAAGRNYAVHAGDHLRLEPSFDGTTSRLEPPASLEVEGQTLSFRVLLPPSYDEQSTKRYSVLYAQDGQSLWTVSEDPYGIWRLDAIVDTLYELDALEEIIVVGIDTAERRTDRLSPVPDPSHQGGDGPAHLRAIIETLIPHVNATYRTRTDRDSTGIMGSSMGGLFAFYAAWSRGDVFGRAACLSSSFWWANRWAVRLVQQGEPPAARPLLYIDSGAALHAGEEDANLRDGFHHTRSMFRALTSQGYVAGVDLHRLVFAGHAHDTASWAARVAVPLQLLFPPELLTPAATSLPQPPSLEHPLPAA